jgi:hypothetical protein
LKEIANNKDMKDGEKRSARQMVNWVFDPWRDLPRQFPKLENSVYRITDVPLVVEANGKSVFVERFDPNGDLPQGLRRSAFIEMQVLVEETNKAPFPLPRYAAASYRFIPEATKFSYEFQRVNNFAAVCAVVRLAKNDRGIFATPPKPNTNVKTPDFIEIKDGEVKPVVLKPKEK